MSPYEVAARERKATAIAMYLLALVEGDPGRIEGLRNAHSTVRAELARRAGQKAPSETTWNRVVELVEKTAQQAPADPFAGIGEADIADPLRTGR